MRAHAQRTARAFTLDAVPALGLSVFAALDDIGVASLDGILAGKLSTYRVVHLVTAGGEDSPAVAVVVDFAPHPNGTLVHLDVLPGAIDNYFALARRATATA